MTKTHLGLILVAIAVHSLISLAEGSVHDIETGKEILNTLREIKHLKDKEIILKRAVAEMLVFNSKDGKRNAGMYGKNKKLPFTSARAGKRGSWDKNGATHGFMITNIIPPMMRGGKRETATAAKVLNHGNTGPFTRGGKREAIDEEEIAEEGPHHRLARLQRVGDSLIADLIKAASERN